MSNTLGATIQKFTANLDKVIEQATVTGDLNINGDLVGEVNGAGEVKIPKLSLQGLADYKRETGFNAGAATLDWETRKLAYDRGREFSIDVMDDDEHMLIVSANVMNEFARTKVVPEVDAIRFARLAENAGATVAANLADADAALAAVLAAEEHMEDQGVALSECVLYLTAQMKTLLRKAQSWRISMGDGAVNTNIQLFDEMKMRVVPGNRFVTKVALAADGAGGYAKATDALDLNFMVLKPTVAQAIQKHEKLRYFSPDVNQARDAHLWQYRLHHDLIVLDNQKPLIYAHTKAAAGRGSAATAKEEK